MTDLFSLPLPEQKRSRGMSSHQRAIGAKDEWLTPPEIIKALGHFDLDPCSPINRPWPTAKMHYTINDDGLSKEWINRVYLNCPYGQETDLWMKRMAEHNNGIALIFARTETQCWFKYVWPIAHSVFFFEGRLNFYHISGTQSRTNSGAPSALISYGAANTEAVRQSGLRGGSW